MAQEELSVEEQKLIEEGKAESSAPETPGASPPAAAEPPAEGEASADGAAPPTNKMVPHAALHEERLKRQERERELAEERQRRAVLEQRTNLILERLTPQQQQQQAQGPEIPAIDKDPLGHIVGLLQQQGQTVNQLVTDRQQQQQVQQQAAVVGEVQRRAAALESDFVREAPDYWDASGYLKNSRHSELAAMGWNDPVARENAINQEAMQIAALALQQGRNPAKVVYDLSVQRGYRARPAAQAPAQANGTAEVAANIARVAQGQEQGASLGNARGAAPRGMTAARLLEMSDNEFSEAMKDPTARALLGN